MSPAYEYEAKVLAMKERENELNGRWLLKDPNHVLFLPDIVQLYPKASFIWIHRDPLEVVPSHLYLQKTLSGVFGEGLKTEQDMKESGRKALNMYSQMINR